MSLLSLPDPTGSADSFLDVYVLDLTLDSQPASAG